MHSILNLLIKIYMMDKGENILLMDKGIDLWLVSGQGHIVSYSQTAFSSFYIQTPVQI